MRTFTRGYAAIAGLATLALVVTACGGSSKRDVVQHVVIVGMRARFPGAQSRHRHTAKGRHAEHARHRRRRLHGLQHQLLHDRRPRPAHVGTRRFTPTRPSPARRTTPYPDLATAAPTISSDGLTYSVTIRSGAMWNTSPAAPGHRRRRAARAQARVQPGAAVRRPARLRDAHRRLRDLLHRFRQGLADIRASPEGVHRQPPDLGRDRVRPDHHLQAGPPGVVLRQPSSRLDPFNPAPVESLNYVPGERRGAAARDR